jgi:AcrR family transcriptional regulator
MFKQAPTQLRSTQTRNHILATALTTFRQRGLDAATMRDISKDAGVALGAAYYYFPSKEAILQAYYDEVQQQHHARVLAAFAANRLDFEDRLKAAFHTKLDILLGDRKLLGALFRYTGEPHHPLSTLGPGTQQNRQQSIAIFELAIGDEKLPADIRGILPTALWALHMGILLYFIYDTSLHQERTRKLVDGILSLVVQLLSLAKLPILKPFRGTMLSLLRDAGLFPDAAAIPLDTLEETP